MCIIIKYCQLFDNKNLSLLQKYKDTKNSFFFFVDMRQERKHLIKMNAE